MGQAPNNVLHIILFTCGPVPLFLVAYYMSFEANESVVASRGGIPQTDEKNKIKKNQAEPTTEGFGWLLLGLLGGLRSSMRPESVRVYNGVCIKGVVSAIESAPAITI